MTARLKHQIAIWASVAWMLIGAAINIANPYPLHVSIIGYVVWSLLIVCAWLLWWMWADHRPRS